MSIYCRRGSRVELEGVKLLIEIATEDWFPKFGLDSGIWTTLVVVPSEMGCAPRGP